MQKINIDNWANKEIELLNENNKGMIFEKDYNLYNNKVLEQYNNIMNSFTDIMQINHLIKLLLNEPIIPIIETDEFYHSINNCDETDNCKRDYKLVRIKRDDNFEYRYNYKIKYHIKGDINPYMDSKINIFIRKYFPVEFPFVSV